MSDASEYVEASFNVDLHSFLVKPPSLDNNSPVYHPFSCILDGVMLYFFDGFTLPPIGADIELLEAPASQASNCIRCSSGSSGGVGSDGAG